MIVRKRRQYVVEHEIVYEWRAGHSWSPPSCWWNAHIMVVKSWRPISVHLAPASAFASYERHVTSPLDHVTTLHLPLPASAHDMIAWRHDQLTALVRFPTPLTRPAACYCCCYFSTPLSATSIFRWIRSEQPEIDAMRRVALPTPLALPPKIATEDGFVAMQGIFVEFENQGSTDVIRESFEEDSKKKSAIWSVDNAGKDWKNVSVICFLTCHFFGIFMVSIKLQMQQIFVTSRRNFTQEIKHGHVPPWRLMFIFIYIKIYDRGLLTTINSINSRSISLIVN